jgi:UDP-N-acetylmuramoyl-tripeptide--D-alanyl-D-alanine ligase
MDPLPLSQITQWSGGKLVAGDPAATVTVACTDTRALKAGDLFIVLRGENFDAHNFLADAAKLGAVGAIVERVPGGLPENFPLILVKDSLRALQQLAANYRRTLPLQVIGLTGSNGKTSTKDLAACVLGGHFRVTKTEGNLNNHIGLPLTMLRARASDQIGVFELGMNHPGEIAPLAALAAPDVAIITNIGVAHIEYMGTREAIAQEKGMLAEALDASGTVILNADDEFSESIARRTKADAVFAGLTRGDVRGENLRADFGGTRFTIHARGHSAEAELPIPGEHMVRNALLAVAAGLTFGLALDACAAALKKTQLTKGRLEQKVVRGIHILDDSYNANPDSMSAALRTLAALPAEGRRIAVLGRMGELGHESERGHRRVGEVAAETHIDCVVSVGEEAAWIADTASRRGVSRVVKVGTTEEATGLLRDLARPGDLVLIKGSRSAKMERIVEGMQTA